MTYNDSTLILHQGATGSIECKYGKQVSLYCSDGSGIAGHVFPMESCPPIPVPVALTCDPYSMLMSMSYEPSTDTFRNFDNASIEEYRGLFVPLGTNYTYDDGKLLCETPKATGSPFFGDNVIISVPHVELENDMLKFNIESSSPARQVKLSLHHDILTLQYINYDVLTLQHSASAETVLRESIAIGNASRLDVLFVHTGTREYNMAVYIDSQLLRYFTVPETSTLNFSKETSASNQILYHIFQTSNNPFSLRFWEYSESGVSQQNLSILSLPPTEPRAGNMGCDTDYHLTTVCAHVPNAPIDDFLSHKPMKCDSSNICRDFKQDLLQSSPILDQTSGAFLLNMDLTFDIGTLIDHAYNCKFERSALPGGCRCIKQSTLRCDIIKTRTFKVFFSLDRDSEDIKMSFRRFWRKPKRTFDTAVARVPIGAVKRQTMLVRWVVGKKFMHGDIRSLGITHAIDPVKSKVKNSRQLTKHREILTFESPVEILRMEYTSVKKCIQDTYNHEKHTSVKDIYDDLRLNTVCTGMVANHTDDYETNYKKTRRFNLGS